MPVLDNYLFFGGNCEEAMRFYERTLGGKLQTLLTYGDSPVPDQQACTASQKDRIMHACLVLDGRMLMASDVPPGMYQPKAGFAVSLNYTTADEARPVFDKLSEGGQVMMPFGKTFWADGFGMVSDRFGTPWMVGGGLQPVGH